MVGVFRRSLSFPNKIPSRTSSKPSISHHIRSISLPCRSHPLISQLRDGVAELHCWATQPESRTSAWLADGLTRLKDLHDCLDDILQLPQTQESLRRQPNSVVENLLEDFLRFVDVYGIFQTSILALKEEQSAAQVGLRKRDELKVSLYVKARKRLAKEMGKLITAVRCINGRSAPPLVCVGDAELSDGIGDVVEVTVTVSLALFNVIATSFGSKKSSWMGLRRLKKKKKAKKAMVEDEGIVEFQQVGAECVLFGLRKKSDEEIRKASKKMQELETCIGGIEICGERIFRGLINARVSLLNTLTM
ncbi:uncharacterized protein LOC133804873 [Humulus lupulus]|uniref:uncharacterized protein LOC133804865 n=1 Tax=Humulus lupulus TaxID=3486 RepID=UPI002B40222E|nr:uncharacterized protein LOC133804865 [Humulus lupulus]XP_062098970.1 uncharacterized protein LOC133804873 [Humulus lupulus]